MLVVPFKGAMFQVCITFFVTLIDMITLYIRLNLIASGGLIVGGSCFILVKLEILEEQLPESCYFFYLKID